MYSPLVLTSSRGGSPWPLTRAALSRLSSDSPVPEALDAAANSWRRPSSASPRMFSPHRR